MALYPGIHDSVRGESEALAQCAILNDRHTSLPADQATAEFANFAKLPTELRFEIWTNCLRHSRFITVTLHHVRDGLRSFLSFPSTKTEHLAPYTKTNSLGNIISSNWEHYRITTESVRPPPSLLSVNHEARGIALEFYRIRLPFEHVAGARTAAPSLFLNPEYDIIHLVLEKLIMRGPPFRTDFFGDFLHDVRAYDPKGIGILNLAMGGRDNLRWHLPDYLLPPQRTAIVETLTNLRRFWYVHFLPSASRTMDRVTWHPFKGHYNRSMPFMSGAQDFRRLRKDPRPIKLDLRFVASYRDLRESAFLWRDLERAFAIQRSRNLEQRCLISVEHPVWQPIDTRSDVDAYLQREKSAWTATEDRLPDKWEDHYYTRDEFEALTAESLPAVGFWLFPSDTLGPLPEGDNPWIHWEKRHIDDLSAHDPELCLFEL